jgi:hypothetical protein
MVKQCLNDMSKTKMYVHHKTNFEMSKFYTKQKLCYGLLTSNQRTKNYYKKWQSNSYKEWSWGHL